MRTTMRHLRASLTLAHPDLAGLLGAADAPPGGPPARGVDGLPDPGGEAGMATAEYAVGILAAVALALVLLKIFNDNEFFTTMLRFVLDLIGRVGGMVG